MQKVGRKKVILLPVLVSLGLFFPKLITAQVLSISGTIHNIQREILPYAQITTDPEKMLLTTDPAGTFSIKTGPGLKTIGVSYVGYETVKLSFVIKRDTVLQIFLHEKINELDAIEINGRHDKIQTLFESSQVSTNLLHKDDLTSIPVLGGEPDVIKTLQLLPGTTKGVEGTSDIFVRGGAADQNLMLLDGAAVYNTSHLFGFLSVFNPDVVESVESVNGGFPAMYGGRLSSIVNVNTTSSIPERTHLTGDVGLLTSRLMIEQPIIEDKVGIHLAGRRTYIDKVMGLAGYKIPYSFYDVNGKLTVKLNEQQIELSCYSGDDVLDWYRDNNDDGDGYLTTYQSGNNIQSLNWKRYASVWKSDVSLIRSSYRYNIDYAFADNGLATSSDIVDYTARLVLISDSILHTATVTAGGEWTRHTISPGVVVASGLMSELFESNASPERVADEISAHAECLFSPADEVIISIGMRGSAGVVTNKVFVNPEPRLNVRYSLAPNQTIKLSYSRMTQYIHRISNSAASTPVDIWYPVTREVRPQTSHQLGVAWQRVVPESGLFISAEGYYKSMSNLIGYEEGTNLFFNSDFENKLIQGQGRAYGIEFLLRKQTGKLTGWISYSLAWSWRKYDEINKSEWFPARYDRRHNGAIALQYALGKRWSVSTVWEFISGARFTPVIGQYLMVAPELTGPDFIPLYSDINSVKLSDAHRLDLAIRFKSKPARKFQWQGFAGIYNVYNRATPLAITITHNKKTGALQYEQPGLFGFLPFISYGFSL
jgi:hypothetical protein